MPRKKGKCKIASESVLATRAAELHNIMLSLESIGAQPMIGGNVLLGIMREGDLLRHGTGIKIHCKAEKLIPLIDKIANILEKKEYECELFKDKGIEKIIARKDFVCFEIEAWHDDGKYRWRWKTQLPRELMENRKVVSLRGQSLQTFSNPIAYLEWRYKTWQTPINSTDRREYENQIYWRGMWQK